MKQLLNQYLIAFNKILDTAYLKDTVKEALTTKVKHFLPFEKLAKVFTINKVIMNELYFYAETTFAHKIMDIKRKKEMNFRMHFLIFFSGVERKKLEADKLFKSFVSDYFKTEAPEFKAGYESAYSIKDKETGKVHTDKNITQKDHTIIATTSYEEINRSQRAILGKLGGLIMQSYKAEQKALKKASEKKAEVKTVKKPVTKKSVKTKDTQKINTSKL